MIITSSCFIFTSSADIVLDGFQFGKEGLSFNSIDLYLIDQQGNRIELEVVNTPAYNGNPGGMNVEVSSSTQLIKGVYYDVVAELHADSYIANSDLYTVVSYNYGVNSSVFDLISVGKTYRWGTSGNGPDENAQTKSLINFEGWLDGSFISYSANAPKTIYEYYVSTIRVVPLNNLTRFSVYVDKLSVQTYTEAEKNANSIINGGHDSPSYSAPDDTTVNEYHDLESSINDSTSDSRSDSISLFNNFGNFLQQSRLAVGLVAVSKVFTDFFSIDWLATIIQFALTLGAFSFILGSATLVIGRIFSNSSRSEASRKADSYRLARTEYFKSRSAYFNSRRKK